MQRAIDQRTHDRAVKEFTAHPGCAIAISAMMELACGAKLQSMRNTAADWLFRNVNVRVDLTNMGTENATASKATNLC